MHHSATSTSKWFKSHFFSNVFNEAVDMDAIFAVNSQKHVHKVNTIEMLIPFGQFLHDTQSWKKEPIKFAVLLNHCCISRLHAVCAIVIGLHLSNLRLWNSSIYSAMCTVVFFLKSVHLYLNQLETQKAVKSKNWSLVQKQCKWLSMKFLTLPKWSLLSLDNFWEN